MAVCFAADAHVSTSIFLSTSPHLSSILFDSVSACVLSYGGYFPLVKARSRAFFPFLFFFFFRTAFPSRVAPTLLRSHPITCCARCACVRRSSRAGCVYFSPFSCLLFSTSRPHLRALVSEGALPCFLVINRYHARPLTVPRALFLFFFFIPLPSIFTTSALFGNRGGAKSCACPKHPNTSSNKCHEFPVRVRLCVRPPS